jgi:N-carbamoyl-L-amino-acid hydrolase
VVSDRGPVAARATVLATGASLLETARIKPGKYHAYVELHIEQGGTLARDKVPIGVVDGIVAIDRYDVVVSGFANHAGTTPMNDRQDALLAAAALTLAVRETVTSEAGAQVGTVGRLEVSPNATNVVPGEVRLSIELRDLSQAKLERLAQKIKERANAIAAGTRTHISIERKVHHDPAIAAPDVQRSIESAASKLRLDSRHLPSGAGHDAQIMAGLMPMGMIFVPSVGGISHSPREWTSWQDCANGANVLLETVLNLAR